MVTRKKAEELAWRFLFSQQRLFEQDLSHYVYDINQVQEVLLDLGPELQAFLLVYPDENVEILFFGKHDDWDI